MLDNLRMRAVQSPIIPVVAELIRQHPGTISLGQGVVAYGPPRQAIDHITHFLADPENHKYKPVHGIPPLLEAIEPKLASENGIRIGADNRLVVTAGGNMGFMNAVLAIADPGDEFVLQTPYYFNHEMAITLANGRPVLVDTDHNYQLRPDAIRRAITPRTRAVVTISPNNPTGAVYPEESLRAVNTICRENGIYHIHDEAYEYFTYNQARHFSPASIPDSAGHTISLFSLSKAYGFASWRIGYMLIPQRLFDPIRKIQDTILICPPVVSQYAAVGALSVGVTYCRQQMPGILDARRIVAEHLDQLRNLCTIPPSDGAFYFFLKVHTRLDAMELVERLIREHGVAVIPGATFGMDQACYLRVAYGALKNETASEGIGRFVSGMKALIKV
jgi:aspartate/methionine/tyrosine aminotransferase